MNDKIKSFLEMSGYKNNIIAERLGLSRQQFYRKMSGKTKWKVDELIKLRKMLRMTNEEFINIFFE